MEKVRRTNFFSVYAPLRDADWHRLHKPKMDSYVIPRTSGKRTQSDRTPPAKKQANDAPDEAQEVSICPHVACFTPQHELGGWYLPSFGCGIPVRKTREFDETPGKRAGVVRQVVRQVAAESTESTESTEDTEGIAGTEMGDIK